MPSQCSPRRCHTNGPASFITGAGPQTRTGGVPQTRTGGVPQTRTGGVPQTRAGGVPQTRTGGVPQTRTGGRRHPKQGCAKYGTGAHETATAMQLRTAFTTCD